VLVFKECIEIQEGRIRRSGLQRESNTPTLVLIVELLSKINGNSRSIAQGNAQGSHSAVGKLIDVPIQIVPMQYTENDIT
jgi:hypothetical protein